MTIVQKNAKTVKLHFVAVKSHVDIMNVINVYGIVVVNYGVMNVLITATRVAFFAALNVVQEAVLRARSVYVETVLSSATTARRLCVRSVFSFVDNTVLSFVSGVSVYHANKIFPENSHRKEKIKFFFADQFFFQKKLTTQKLSKTKN